MQLIMPHSLTIRIMRGPTAPHVRVERTGGASSGVLHVVCGRVSGLAGIIHAKVLEVAHGLVICERG